MKVMTGVALALNGLALYCLLLVVLCGGLVVQKLLRRWVDRRRAKRFRVS